MSCNRAEHKTEYLKPMQLFRETGKRTYHMPSAAFVALSFYDEYVSVATSDDCYLSAHIYGVLPRDETLLDKLVEVVQSLKNDYGWDLEGIIVAYNNSVVNIHNLMEELCKKGNIESLKYTCWKDDIKAGKWDLEGILVSYNNSAPPPVKIPIKGNNESLKYACWKDDIKGGGAEFESNRFGSLFRARKLPIEKRVERISAQFMLETYLDVFNTLHREKDVFSTLHRRKDEDWGVVDEERMDKEKKMILKFLDSLREKGVFNTLHKDEDGVSERKKRCKMVDF